MRPHVLQHTHTTQERERLAKEEADRNDPDQPVGDPHNWNTRAVVKWFLNSKVERYACVCILCVVDACVCACA